MEKNHSLWLGSGLCFTAAAVLNFISAFTQDRTAGVPLGLLFLLCAIRAFRTYRTPD